MPELSRFYGIIVRMFSETGESHHRPHIHVYYQEGVAVYAIDSIELLAGSLPGRQQRLVEAWIELYQDELLDNWHLISINEPPYRIPPLHRGWRSEVEIMKHLIVRVEDFEIVGPYTLRVAFDDGTVQIIDFEPVLYGHFYGPLRNVELFNQVRIDPDAHTLVWPNDADFDPATLYDWNKGDGAELAARLKQLAR